MSKLGFRSEEPVWKVERHVPQMRMREAFAMAAMQGLVEPNGRYDCNHVTDKLVETSVHLADALIAELNKEEE